LAGSWKMLASMCVTFAVQNTCKTVRVSKFASSDFSAGIERN
jgi:hypothetical protein